MPAKQSNPVKNSGSSWHFIGSLCVNNLTDLHSVGKIKVPGADVCLLPHAHHLCLKPYTIGSRRMRESEHK